MATTGIEKMTVAQLNAYAKEKGLEFPPGVTTKEAKVAYIKANNSDEIEIEIGDTIVKVPASRAGDLRVLEALREGERAEEAKDSKASIYASLDLLNAVFEESKDVVKEAVRKPDGTIPTTDIIYLVQDFLDKANAKN